MSQRQTADALGITHPAVSQQLKFGPGSHDVHPEVLLEAVAPILKALATENATPDSRCSARLHGMRPARTPTSTWVETPEGTSSFDFISFQQLLEQVLGREVDLVSYGGLKAKLDDDIRREAVLLGWTPSGGWRLADDETGGGRQPAVPARRAGTGRSRVGLAVAKRNFIIHEYDEINPH